MQRAQVRQHWKDGKLSLKCCKSAERSALHDAQTIKALFEAAGVADWDATLVENGIDSLKLVQLFKVTSTPYLPRLINCCSS